jgi:hypothetical protein
MAPRKRKPAAKFQPVTFLPVERVFKAQVKVVATRDLNGWVPKIGRAKRKKWHIGAGRIGHLDEDTAREFAIKGYVEILDGTIKPYSEDEAAEVLATVTTLQLGGSNG